MSKRKETLRLVICPMCHKKAYVHKTKVMFIYNGWQCMRCGRWWTEK